jgi:hypothetical protein
MYPPSLPLDEGRGKWIGAECDSGHGPGNGIPDKWAYDGACKALSKQRVWVIEFEKEGAGA